MMTGKQIVGTCCFIALMCGAIGVVLFSDLEEGRLENRRRTRFTQDVAEDVSIRKHGYYGIDFISCKSCKIEKRKLGCLTIGGMNVLALEDLSIVLPPQECVQTCEVPDKAIGVGTTAGEIAQGLGLSDSFLKMRTGGLRFSGLRIEKLEVAALDSATNVVPKFSAASARGERKGLRLYDCVIQKDNASFPVEEALLEVKPTLRLVWSGGEMKI